MTWFIQKDVNMEEKSNIEILKELAKATNRIINVKEIPYPLTGIRTLQRYKRMLSMPSDAAESSYFIWYSDPYANLGNSTIYCGAFIPIPSHIQSRLSMRRKYGIDKVPFFSSPNRNTLGSKRFDTQVLIKGQMDQDTKRWLSQTRLQSRLVKALELDKTLTISINEHKLDFVSSMEGKSYLALVNPQEWYFEKEKIEAMLAQIEGIKALII